MTDITVLNATAVGVGEVFQMTSQNNFLQIQNSASTTGPSYTDFVATVRMQRSPDGSTDWNYTDTDSITSTQCYSNLPTNEYFRFSVDEYTSGTILATVKGGVLI